MLVTFNYLSIFIFTCILALVADINIIDEAFLREKIGLQINSIKIE